MLRGAIDFYDGLSVGGWVYTPGAAPGGLSLLAFVDDACVGTGRADRFRQDLADAGLGDGRCGFNFPVSLADPDDAARLHVRVEGSDFVLLQRGARVAGARTDERPTHPDRIDYSAESVDWMRARHWLDQTDYDFLRHIHGVGLFDRTLHTAAAERRDPAAEAGRMLELYRQGPVRLQETLIRLYNIGPERPRLVQGAAIPIVAVHAPAGAVRLLEGSRGVRRTDALDRAMHRPCGVDRLLLLDTRAVFAGEGDVTARVFRAVARG